MDAAREQAALETARRRRLTTVALRNGKWGIRNERGEAPDAAGEYDDPVLAIEAGDAALTAGETRDRKVTSERLFDAMQRGTHVPFPVVRQSGDVDWVVVEVSKLPRAAINTATASGPFDGLKKALIDVARIVNEPEPQAAPPTPAAYKGTKA